MVLHERLIIFTRYPEPGKSKTRLISSIGAQGAATLQREMAASVLATARLLSHVRPVSIEISFAGGTKEAMKECYGNHFAFSSQKAGDLGERMDRAFREAFQQGCKRVVLIGSDCPEVSHEILTSAFQDLKKADLVLGPAKDGGYYLIGLKKPAPDLFLSMQWGTREVFAETLERARQVRLHIRLAKALTDVDRPEDLALWEACKKRPRPEREIPLLSIIIPTRNEGSPLLETIRAARESARTEIIVVDSSTEESFSLPKVQGVTHLRGAPGRARQMNMGAEQSRGEILLFLHADSILPKHFDAYVRTEIKRKKTAGGAFKFCTDSKSPGMGIIEGLVNLRTRLLKLPYGDQGIFVRAEVFRKLGGFSEMPIMEDFEFVRRLRKEGKISILPVPVISSSRRWESTGLLRTTLINQAVIAGYYFGVSPDRLARWYHGADQGSERPY